MNHSKRSFETIFPGNQSVIECYYFKVSDIDPTGFKRSVVRLDLRHENQVFIYFYKYTIIIVGRNLTPGTVKIWVCLQQSRGVTDDYYTPGIIIGQEEKSN